MTSFLNCTHHLKGKEPSTEHSRGAWKWDLVPGFAWFFVLVEESQTELEKWRAVMRMCTSAAWF